MEGLLERWLAPDTGPAFLARWRGRQAVLVHAPEGPWPTVDLDEVAQGLDTAPAGTTEWIEGGVTRPAPPGFWSEAQRRRASLRINRIHTLVPSLGALAHRLREELGEEIGANGYVSWDAESPGLAPHTDPYDVLVLQLTGCKGWALQGFDGSPPVPLRTESGRTHGTVGTLETASGQVLYLPPGLRHQARARSTGAPSFHVTFAVRTKTSHSFVEWLASTLTRSAPVPLPPRAVASDETYRDHLEALSERCAALLADPDRAARAFLAYREGHEYERTEADLTAHRAGDARRDR